MFIAHLPSGYILANYLYKKIKQTHINKKVFWSAVLIGSIFPDFDLFYFYLIDNRAVHHHKYFMHWFSFWIPIFLMALVWLRICQYKSKFATVLSLFSGAVLIHICLDTFVGDVWLFMPFIDKPYVFFEVTPRYQPWWLNFVFHWSFGVELVICLYALHQFRRDKKINCLQSSDKC